MKTKAFFLITSMILAIIVSSCRTIDPSVESTFSSEEPVTPSTESPGNDPAPYSGIQWGANAPETAVKTLPSLPDEAGLSKGNLDSRNGSVYHIAALDIDLTVPEGCFLYHIKGEYKDADGNPVTLEFVDEYILTVVEKTEEELIADIRSWLDQDQNSHPLGYRSPGYVLYSFKVMPAAYLPIESFYVSDLPLNREYRFKDDCLVMPGLCEWRQLKETGKPLKWVCYHDRESVASLGDEFSFPDDLFPVYAWEEAVLASSYPNTLSYSYTGKPLPDDPPIHLARSWPLFRIGSAERKIPAFVSSWESVQNADTSVVNDMWWDQYEKVLSELDLAPAEEAKGYVTGDWHEDKKSDHRIKAWLLANLNIYEETDPNDIMVLFKDTDHCRLFQALRISRPDDSGHEAGTSSSFSFTKLEEGIDYLFFCDMDFARAYALKYLQEQ